MMLGTRGRFYMKRDKISDEYLDKLIIFVTKQLKQER